VLLNWTTGPANMAHAVKTLGIRYVITSKKLIDRLGIQIEGAEYLFLEDVRAGISKLEAAMTLLSTYVLPGRLLHGLPRPNMDAPAVVLFTSGSESTPKAVPLSHRNLVTNVRASLTRLDATRNDVLLGFLPPFHSFGLLANVLAPVLAGIRVAHYPDPTDAAGLVRTVAAYKTTIVVTTPTFLSYMFGVAGPQDLASLRVIVTGAEKCPEALFERAKQMAPHAFIMEGYGITECSPVVAGNVRDKLKPGSVGPPVTDVETCVVDPDSHQPLPSGATGMLLVRGPSIFNGYLNYDGPDPFTEVNGKRWYVTGDLVRLDEDGYIYFCGRLKRFLKIGGEMVSLPALEEPLSRLYPPTEDGPQVAVEGVDAPARWIVLLTVPDISLKQANDILAQAGLRGVMRLDAVERVAAIPVLGTGKTDYKVLRKRVAERNNND
jgi:long-chain-fatty-acid--[acyl-carrier-protein] ligase